MADERDIFDDVANASLPGTSRPKKKRVAPSQRMPIRRDPEAQSVRYGRPTTLRLPDEFREMLKAVETKYNVRAADLVQLATTQFVKALEAGKTDLPLDEETGGPLRLRLPDVPDVKQG